jgi:hypothetical protein
MNKTQKSAIFCLVTFLFGVVVIAYPLISIFILKSWPESFFSRFWSMIAYFVFIAASIIFLRKKPFVSVWILLAAACIIPRFIVGETGVIPVYVLPFINLGIFMIAMLVHSIAILVQYSTGGKRGEK